MAEQATRSLVPGAASGRTRWYRILLRDRTVASATTLIVLILLVAVAAQWIAPYPEGHLDYRNILRPPSPGNWLGTDHLGRDVLSQIIHGSRISVLVAIASTLLALVVGTVWGSVAGYLGGWFDELSMRMLDIMFAFPYIVLAMVLVALIGPGTVNIILVIGLIRLPQFTRLARGSVLKIRDAEYVQAASAIGSPASRIVLKHLIPNILGPLVVMVSLSMATAVNVEGALSFLGLGVTPPQSSWGTVLSAGRNYIIQAPWITTAAGVAITLTIIAFNLLGDGLRDALDPRYANRQDG